MAFAEDLAAFFDTADHAVAATFGAQSANVILEAPGEVLLGEAVSTDYSMLYRATDFASPALTHGSAVTVDGVSYVVREVLSVDDGKLKRAMLSKV